MTLPEGRPPDGGGLPEGIVNKRVSFGFSGARLSLDLSQSLFSSFDVDSGSRLLLKTLAQRADLAGARSVLDAGCGTGVLALALAAAHPGLAVDAVDRDALAVALTAANARLNAAAGVRAAGSLVLDGRVRGPYDLAVSNLPAKAGHPVLEALVRRLGALVGPEGRAAVVVVTPLKELVRSAAEASGRKVLYAEETREHAVYHYAAGSGGGDAGERDDGAAPWMSPFLRNAGRFEAAGVRWRSTTAYGLPDFDTPSHEQELALEALGDSVPEGVWLFWRPGQGHLPAALLGRGAPSRLVLAGRDLLSLEVSRVNALAAGAAPGRIETLHLPFYFLVEGEADFAAFSPDDDPGWRWQPRFGAEAARLVRPGGLALVSGPSAAIARIGELAPRFRVLRDQRRRGFRAMLLRRAQGAGGADPGPQKP